MMALVCIRWCDGTLAQVVADDPDAVSVQAQIQRLWWLLPRHAQEQAYWEATPLEKATDARKVEWP